MHENERYRGLIETLLRHPAFTPFINDISKDPSVLMQQQPQQQQPPQQQQQQSVAPTPQPAQAQPQQQPQQDMKPDFLDFDASQLQIPHQPQPEPQHVGLAMIPENDFSKLNINGFNSMNFNSNFNRVNAYAVTELPTGPDPVELLMESPAYLPRSFSSAISEPASATSPGLSILLAKLDKSARKLAANHAMI